MRLIKLAEDLNATTLTQIARLVCEAMNVARCIHTLTTIGALDGVYFKKWQCPLAVTILEKILSISK